VKHDYKDSTGRDIEVGDKIVYPWRIGGSMYVKHG
jgi:hypothetical protein